MKFKYKDARRMNFPKEVILRIFKDDMDHLMLLNKEYTELYLRLYWSRCSSGQLFDDLMRNDFPYHSYIQELHITIENGLDSYLWSACPFSMLTSCTKISYFSNVGYLKMMSNLSFNIGHRRDNGASMITDMDEMKMHIEYATMLLSIRENMPWLKVFSGHINNQIAAKDELSKLQDITFKAFSNSNLEEIDLRSSDKSFDLLNTMPHLRKLDLGGFNESQAEALSEFVYPHITQLCTSTTDDDVGPLLKLIMKSFPNLYALEFCFVNYLSKFIPKSVKDVTISLNSSDLPLFETFNDNHFDHIGLSTVGGGADPGAEGMTAVMRVAKNWTISIGATTFFIASSFKKHSDISKRLDTGSGLRINRITGFPDLKDFHLKRHGDVSYLLSSEHINGQDMHELMEDTLNACRDILVASGASKEILEWANTIFDLCELEE